MKLFSYKHFVSVNVNVIVNVSVIVAMAMAMALGACKSKNSTPDGIIIAEPPAAKAEEAPDSTQKGDYTQQRDIDWQGEKCSIVVTRTRDNSLPIVKDEYGKTYYDNKITVRITRADGSEVYNRTFHKSDFAAYFGDSKAAREGGLLGIVFDKVDGNGNLSFAASVGSPDRSSDSYCPLRLKIGKGGSYSIEKDNTYDEAIAPAEDDDAN